MKSLNDSLDECKQIDAESKWMPSFDKYLQRLATYELFKWFSKPAEFSPIECARRGWTNFSKDTLKCVACSRLFYFYTQSPTKKFSGASNGSAKPANDPAMLVDKHNHNCPWRTLIVPNHLIKVDIVDEEKAYRSFVKLRATFQKCEKLPLLTLETVESFNSLLDESDAAKIEPREKMINIIASCGWSYKEDKNILTCDKCLRSIGLWMYKRESGNESKFWDNKEDKSNENDQTNTASHESAESRSNLKNYPIKKRKLNEIEPSEPEKESSSKENGSNIDKKKLFDPIGEHFVWCPWLDDKPDTVVLNFRSNLGVKRLRKSLTNQSICYANFQIINRHVAKSQVQPVTRKLAHSVSSKSSSSLADLVTRSVEESKTESQRLIERAKSIKSLLINCTAQAPN